MDNYTLNLTNEEVQLIGNALLELPAKISINLINNINDQLKDQAKKKDESIEDS